jgi:peptidoglycan/xylan/chitin deacetylase (PgdA/CDA1 family)
MLSTLIKSGCHFSGVFTLLRTVARRPRALVLRYHSVAAPEDRADLYLDQGLTLTPEAFERQLQFLTSRYRIVPLQDIVDRLHRGFPPQKDTVAITFDDGFRDNYVRAFPILRRYQAPATFYLATGCIDNRQFFWVAQLRYLLTVTRAQELRTTKPEEFFFNLVQSRGKEEAFRTLVVRMKNIPTPRRLELLAEVTDKLAVDDTFLRNIMMTWEEVREMHNHGMDFGAHTVTHPNLPNTTPEEAEREVRESKEMIEGQLRTRVHDFSYPNGRGSSHLTEQVKEIVRQAGFRSAVTSLAGCIESGNDLFTLKRIGVYKKHGRLPLLSWEIESNRWKR